MALEENKEIASIAVRSYEIAIEHQHEMVTLEHVLASLLENEEIQKCFSALNLDSKPLMDVMESFFEGGFIATTTQKPIESIDFSVLFTRVIGSSLFSSKKTPPAATDVLLHLMQIAHEDSHAVTALLKSGLTTLMLKKYLSHGASKAKTKTASSDLMGGQDGPSDNEPSTEEEAIQLLEKYCVDLNKQASEGKIDPLIGRADVIDQMTLIVSRRSKNNVVLVGQPGTGKTAIAEGLAYKIVRGTVPKVLLNSTVYSLDIASLVAGTKFRGDFEERMKLVLKSLALVEDSILFIDEIHTIMGAGSGSNSSMDVANLLKPALAKGSLRCIGSTTEEEYRKHFEKDRALARRFKKVKVNEPTIEEAKQILHGLKSAYEKFHGVKYSNEAIDAAVDLTARYVHDTVLPDKAIDIMDNAGARHRITDFDKKKKTKTVTVKDIEAEIAKVAKIPAQEIAESETAVLTRLEADLKKVVFGQDRAITVLTDAVFVARAGLRQENKPEGCYLFSGFSGSGKTEVAKQLAKTLNIPLIKFDMSEYMEKHSVSKLIGSPPGYVGFGDGGAGDGLLVNAIDSNPSCVLLLDEIEKAHQDVYNILLQVMDDARITNSNGKTVDCRNIILIMTSNAGSSAVEKNTIGFGRVKEIEQVDQGALKTIFTPEFRNRLDAIVSFDRLHPDTMSKIVRKFMAELSVLTERRNVKIDIDENSLEWLAKKGYDPVMGARPLHRVIAEYIKKPLSKMMLIGELKDNNKKNKVAAIRVVDDQVAVVVE